MVSKRAVDSATSDVKDDVMERDADFQTYLLPFFSREEMVDGFIPC